ncbi:MAG: type IX secretion system membrane protein PorP/SprF [Prolixibacteraceae bacterium]
MKQKLLRHIIIILFILLSISSFAQQDPMFTQYMNNPQLINPAYTGSLGSMNFNGIFRKQWMAANFPWAPTTTSMSISSPFKDYRVGVGLDFMYDDIGPVSLIGLFTNYAYHLDFNNGARLSLGLKGGFNYYQKSLQGLDTGEYDYFVQNNLEVKKPLVNVGVGTYYYTEKFFLGASVPTLVRNSLVDFDNTLLILSRKELHFFLTTGYVFDINPLLKFKPTTMFRIVGGAPINIELTGTMIFAEKLWFGLMYRVGDAVAVHARYEVQDGFQIGYSYDLTTSELNQYNSGTHEIFFNYTIKKRGRRILSPRYF